MSSNTLTYHGKPELKAERIANAKRHAACDMLIAGTYDDGEGHGCSVGCDAIDLGYHGDSPHGVVADHWGTPLWMEHLRDAIFEGLLNSASRRNWHIDIAKAIPVGVDLKLVYHRLMSWLLGPESPSAAGNSCESVRDAISSVRSLHDRVISGEDVSDSEWSSARSAARSAADSARSAAWSAARSAAWSAARSAALSAADSSADSSARSAADSSARSAARSSAWSAAWSATWAAIAVKLLDLLRSAN